MWKLQVNIMLSSSNGHFHWNYLKILCGIRITLKFCQILNDTFSGKTTISKVVHPSGNNYNKSLSMKNKLQHQQPQLQQLYSSKSPKTFSDWSSIQRLTSSATSTPSQPQCNSPLNCGKNFSPRLVIKISFPRNFNRILQKKKNFFKVIW